MPDREEGRGAGSGGTKDRSPAHPDLKRAFVFSGPRVPLVLIASVFFSSPSTLPLACFIPFKAVFLSLGFRVLGLGGNSS
jgi:hypothetical protein